MKYTTVLLILLDPFLSGRMAAADNLPVSHREALKAVKSPCKK